MRSVERYPWESSSGTICLLSWYLEWNLCDQVLLWLSGFITSSLNSRSTLSGESQRLIISAVNAPSLFNIIFRPPIASTDTSVSFRRHCHNARTKRRSDTDKKDDSDNAHLQCHHLHEWIDAWGCENRRYFRSMLTLRIHGSCHKHHMKWSFSWSWRKRNLEVAQEENIFSLLCMSVLYHAGKKALCSMSVLKFGRTSTSNHLTVFTTVKLSAFADDLVKRICQTILSWDVSKVMRILPEQASFRNMEIMWIVSFCSGKWIVLAVVTKFFASVLMWISATSPDMSIQNPRRNWHEPKHCMNEYNSAPVVESTVLSIFWPTQSTKLPYDIPSFEEWPRSSAKSTAMPLREDPSSLFW